VACSFQFRGNERVLNTLLRMTEALPREEMELRAGLADFATPAQNCFNRNRREARPG
jgi:hypothetical protein